MLYNNTEVIFLIETFFHHEEISEGAKAKFDAAVVIDVLRATSTIITALANGADFVIPVDDISTARNLKIKNPDYVIAGERGGLKVEGFDLGNSPLEFSELNIFKKSIILTTTNGTRAITKAKGIAKEVFVAAFLNAERTSEKLKKHKSIAIVCAGNDGKPSYEDTQVAGLIIAHLIKRREYRLSDSSLVALKLWETLKIPDFSGSHSQKLCELGFNRDIDWCKQVDLFPIVAQLCGEKIVRTE